MEKESVLGVEELLNFLENKPEEFKAIWLKYLEDTAYEYNDEVIELMASKLN